RIKRGANANANAGDWATNSAKFLSGEVYGFCEGGIDLVWGNVKMAVMKPIEAGEWIWGLITHPRATIEEAYRQQRETVQMVWNMVTMVWDIGTQGVELMQDIAAEMPPWETLPYAQMPPTMRVMLELGAEVFNAAMQDYLDRIETEPFEAGREMGQGLFQGFSLLAPYAKAGQLAQIGKIEFLEGLLANSNRIKFLSGGRVQGVIKDMLRFLRLTKDLCFPAGTAVLTDHGPVPIERIRVGDRVLSRDPSSGAQGYQRVTELVTTHPEALYRVQYRLVRESRAPALMLPEARRTFGSDGKRTASGDDDDPDLGVVRSTGNHPFYV